MIIADLVPCYHTSFLTHKVPYFPASAEKSSIQVPRSVLAPPVRASALRNQGSRGQQLQQLAIQAVEHLENHGERVNKTLLDTT